MPKASTIPLISFTNRGLYCSAGDFYIDPWRPVDKAVITHAHSDHAKNGNKQYLCHHFTKPLLEARLGNNHYQSIGWNEVVRINGVSISLHPAGHMIGSSQIRVSHQDEVWVVSGDYKTENDGISGAFEPIQCNTFITESTFGLPIYNWLPQHDIYTKIQQWVQNNKAKKTTCILFAYSLGKAQRLLQALAMFNEPIYLHGAIWNMQMALAATGIAFPQVERITPETLREKLKGAIVIAPPGAEGTSWMKKMEPYSTAVCSGWMQVRGNARRRNTDMGFALSDHADWKGLLAAITATGAEKVFVTHGFQSALSRYLNEQGIWSAEVKTAYGNGEEENENGNPLTDVINTTNTTQQ